MTEWINVKGDDRLVELARELERQKKTKKDYIVAGSDLSMKEGVDGKPELVISRLPSSTQEAAYTGHFKITPYCHGQIAEKCKIPRPYYNRMLEEGKTELLADNVNAWIGDKERRLVRTLDGNARAILSDRYRIMDNYDIMMLTLQQFVEQKDKGNEVEIQRCDVTDTHMYIKGVMPHTQEEIRSGDSVIRGVVVRNSEVGAGAFSVEPFLVRLVCQNGMIGEKTLNKVHLGRQKDVGELLSDATRQLEDQALWSGIKDVIGRTFDDRFFNEWVQRIRDADSTEIPRPVEAVDLVASEYKISDGMKTEILNRFRGNTVWDLTNAITASAHESGINYEGQIELEKIGGNLVQNNKLIAQICAV